MKLTVSTTAFVTKDIAFEDSYARMVINGEIGYGDNAHNEFITCWIRNMNLADRLRKAKVKKGSYIQVLGNLDPKLSSYKKDGKKVPSLDLSLELLDWGYVSPPKKKDDEDVDDYEEEEEESPPAKRKPRAKKPDPDDDFDDIEEFDLDEEDLP